MPATVLLRFRYDPPKGPQQMPSESDVVPVKGLSVDGVTGFSAVSQAARVLGLSDSLVKPAMSFFESRNPRPEGCCAWELPRCIRAESVSSARSMACRKT